jgi:hypothetical protein
MFDPACATTPDTPALEAAFLGGERFQVRHQHLSVTDTVTEVTARCGQTPAVSLVPSVND